MTELERFLAEPVVVICDDALFRCRCVKPAGHVEAGDETHACGPEVCGGSWRWFDEHRFHAPSMPHGEYRGAVMPPPEDIDRGFVQCDEAGSPMVLPVQRGVINFLAPPSLLALGFMREESR